MDSQLRSHQISQVMNSLNTKPILLSICRIVSQFQYRPVRHIRLCPTDEVEIMIDKFRATDLILLYCWNLHVVLSNICDDCRRLLLWRVYGFEEVITSWNYIGRSIVNLSHWFRRQPYVHICNHMCLFFWLGYWQVDFQVKAVITYLLHFVVNI